MRKKLVTSIVAISLLIGMTSFADSGPQVMVNGNLISTNAVLIDDRTYVPLRGVFETVGADVSWDSENSTAVINMANTGPGIDDNLIPGIIARTSPSVVGIIGKYKPEYASPGEEGLAHGSGIIIKSGGEILTNAHVVKDMFMILVVMNDGKGYEAKLKYIDEESDLAVIKINKIGLPVAKFAAKEAIAVGKTVIAIGVPITFSLLNSATVGHISGLNRSVGGEPYRLIQTDAAINPGNSGGALVNLNGEVVGVTSLGYSGYSIQNTGFAIPVDTIKYVLNHFENYGRVKRAYFKAEFKEDWLAEMGIPSQSGVTIKNMDPASPLLQAGFKVGNTLVSLNATPVNSLVELNELLKECMPGDTVQVGINDGASIRYADIVLVEKPEKK